MLVKFYIYSKLQESCVLECVPSKGDIVEFEDDPNIYTVCQIKWQIKNQSENYVQIFVEY